MVPSSWGRRDLFKRGHNRYNAGNCMFTRSVSPHNHIRAHRINPTSLIIRPPGNIRWTSRQCPMAPMGFAQVCNEGFIDRTTYPSGGGGIIRPPAGFPAGPLQLSNHFFNSWDDLSLHRDTYGCKSVCAINIISFF